MSLDDTLLDLIAAQVRACPPLDVEETSRLLAGARRAPGPAGTADAATLASHLLGVALDAVLALRAPEDDVAELYQEGSVAVVEAVDEYLAGSGGAAGLRAFVRVAVDARISAVQAEERRRREEGEAFVRDSRLLDMAEVEMRHRLGRPATAAELAAVLEWTQARVELVGEMLDTARRLHDESLLPFLDDEG